MAYGGERDAGLIRRFGWNPWSSWQVDAVALWGSSDRDVFAVGRSGLHHFDGTAWGMVSGGRFLTVFGRGPSDVVVAGENGAVLRFNGSTWTPLPKAFNEDLIWTWLDDNGRVEVMNGVFTTLRHDNSSWVHSPRQIPSRSEGCTPTRTVWMHHEGRALVECGLSFERGTWSSRDAKSFSFTVRGQQIELSDGAISINGVMQYQEILEALGIRCNDARRSGGITPRSCPGPIELTGGWTDGKTLFVGGTYDREHGYSFVVRLGARRLVPRAEDS